MGEQPAPVPRLQCRPRDIVICCDGTWCGEAARTTTNIEILARCFANKKGVLSGVDAGNDRTSVYYFDGIGLDGRFSEYVVNGALALSIQDKCVEAYKAIVDKYEPGSKIWLFGLSRGAHTVRSVAGMINNCGILRRDTGKTEIADCQEVYDVFRNRDPMYAPDQPFSVEFRRRWSHPTNEPPIRFMGLLDTVGALGVPTVNAGVSFSYEFYDQNVTSEVQTVCQALAVHDRLSAFQPCFVRRKQHQPAQPAQPQQDTWRFWRPAPGPLAQPTPQEEREPEPVLQYRDTDIVLETEEVWFPGAHYDIGRQRFVFPRNHGVLEALLHFILLHTNFLGLNISYTVDLANAPLLWLIEKVKLANSADQRPELLPLAPEEYPRKYAEDGEPVLWRVPFFGPLRINAYDRLYNSVFLLVLRFLLMGEGLLLALLDRQLLVDRRIPLYPHRTCFYRSLVEGSQDPADAYRFRLLPLPWFLRGFTYSIKFKSQAFQRFMSWGLTWKWEPLQREPL